MRTNYSIPLLLCLVLLSAACAEPSPDGDAGALPDTSGMDDGAANGAGGVDEDGDGAGVTPDLSAVDPVVRRHVERVGADALVRWGACPFECCVYREWVAESDVPVRAEPRSDARLVTTIPTGAHFDADTGFVRITSPQLVIVTQPVEAYRLDPRSPSGGEATTLAAGDTLLVLDYEGEGHYVLMRGEELVSAAQFWPSDESDWPPADQVRGEVIGDHEAEWWAHVVLPEGVEGWIDAYAAELGNVDACG